MPIALVDGNKVSRENLRNVLVKEETNVSVEAFDSAKACIHFLNQENSWPTLILITNNIPDSSCVALAEQIHDGRFTYVGIAHQCHAHHSASVFSLCSLLLVDFCQSLFEETHSAEDDTAVHLELGLTWSTQTNRTLTATRS